MTRMTRKKLEKRVKSLERETSLPGQEQMEEKLARSEEKYRSLFYNAQVALFRTSIDGKLLEINKRYAEIAGYSTVEDCMAEFVPGDAWGDLDGRSEFLKKIQETGSVSDYETKIIRRDGTEAWILFSATIFPDQGYIEGSIVDITGRKEMENALRESEARFKALHNASFGGITIHDKGVIIECNQGLSEITGYPADELIGMDGLMLIAESSREKVMGNILAGYEKPYEAMGLRKNGEEYPIRLEARNVPYKGKMVRTVEFRDITEQKKMEQERERLQEQLTQAVKMESVGRLAGGVAHDFNNMLSIILGNTEILLEDIGSSSSLADNLHEIQKAAQRSTSLTRQLLAFARKQTISPQILDLNQAVEGIIQMLRRLIGEDIDLSWRPQKDLWPVKIDPSQVDQILANLCVNARDAIKDVGKITIETANVRFDRSYCEDHVGFVPGEYVMIAVTDSGCGIPKETLNYIFEPFFTTKKTSHGTGLGLATVYGIVKQNNGFINVYSEQSQGTAFRIYLTRCQETCEPQEQKIPEKSISKARAKILLVEDEEAILKVTEMMLERMGYIVLPASSPEQALQICQEPDTGRIDLLMTDVVMPGMNGRDLARKISGLYPGLKCLFMSGYTANVIAHHGILDEGLNFINKPFSKQDLSSKLREIMGK